MFVYFKSTSNVLIEFGQLWFFWSKLKSSSHLFTQRIKVTFINDIKLNEQSERLCNYKKIFFIIYSFLQYLVHKILYKHKNIPGCVQNVLSSAQVCPMKKPSPTRSADIARTALDRTLGSLSIAAHSPKACRFCSLTPFLTKATNLWQFIKIVWSKM